MPDRLQKLIETWDGLAVVCRFDTATSSWIFICLHDDTLGPATGGTRMAVYPGPDAALLDAMRLAEGMTHKLAGIEAGFGGGKAVLAVPKQPVGEERQGLLKRYGRLIHSLRGAFLTGEDLGTTTADMEIVSRETDYVHGFDPVGGGKVDPSPYTSRGVFSGIQVALKHTYGSESLSGRSVLIQGLGNVGGHLAETLSECGAKVLVSDIDPSRTERAAKEYGAQVVPPARLFETACDVYAPCAIGATLNQQTIPGLACRIVVGCANNQLATPDDAERLRQRDILYVPDYIVNAGGALAFGLMHRGVPPGEELLERVATIGSKVEQILQEADERGETPLAAARRRVEATLSRARQEKAEVARPLR